MIIDGLGPCDFHSPAAHIAASLDRVAPAALSLGGLAKDFTVRLQADLNRVKRFAGLAPRDDAGGILWMITKVVDYMEFNGDQRQFIRHEDGRFSLVEGLTLADIRFDGGPVVVRRPSDTNNFHEPFNPMRGAFTENTRYDPDNTDIKIGGKYAGHVPAIIEKTDIELRESLLAFGWIEQLPAFVDENGVVLVGHRRLKLAAELGIEPVIKPVTCGSGDAGDVIRLGLALASNLGFREYSKKDRQYITVVLHGPEHNWSLPVIAELFKVSVRTLNRDKLLARTSNSDTMSLSATARADADKALIKATAAAARAVAAETAKAVKQAEVQAAATAKAVKQAEAELKAAERDAKHAEAAAMVQKGSTIREAALATDLGEDAVMRHPATKAARAEYKAAHPIPERKRPAPVAAMPRPVPVKVVKPRPPAAPVKILRASTVKAEKEAALFMENSGGMLTAEDRAALLEDVQSVIDAWTQAKGKLAS